MMLQLYTILTLRYNNEMNIRGNEFLKNLALKRNQPDFQYDINALLPIELNQNFEEVYQFVVNKIINKLP